MAPSDPGRATAIVSGAHLFLGFMRFATSSGGVHRVVEQKPSTIRPRGRDMLEFALMDAQNSTRTARLAEARERLAELARLPDDWGGSEKPSERSLAMAWSLVQSMERYGHPVSRIAPMADGGLSVRYLEGPRSARFDVYNEGGIVVATRAGRGVPAQYAELPDADAVAELSRFLQHDDDATSGG